ncbi:MAG: hypothetical protein R3C11_22655 [Planctomycetaceae bacterium]
MKARDRNHLGGSTYDELGYEVCGWTDLGRDIEDLHLLKKGDPKHPGPVVEPAHLSFLPDLEKPFNPPTESDSTSKRRLQLAEWIVDPNNPSLPV